LSKLPGEFEEIEFTHLGREGNQLADTLATLASTARIDFGYKVQLVHIDIGISPAHCCLVEIDGSPCTTISRTFYKTRHIPWGHPK